MYCSFAKIKFKYRMLKLLWRTIGGGEVYRRRRIYYYDINNSNYCNGEDKVCRAEVLHAQRHSIVWDGTAFCHVLPILASDFRCQMSELPMVLLPMRHICTRRAWFLCNWESKFEVLPPIQQN